MSDDRHVMVVRDAENRGAERNLEKLFDAVFGETPFYGLSRSRTGLQWAPAVDIRETDNELIVYAALPGLDKEDVGLEVRDNTLVVTGRMKPLGSDEDSWVRRELPRGEFYRAFSLPADVQSAKVRAAMKNGVLEVRLPKAEDAKPRKITVE